MGKYNILPVLITCVVSVSSDVSASIRKRNDTKQPHIIVIVADDLGWNDVGFHGMNNIPTPNIDALALSGVSLHNYYVQPLCTPSRSAIMTGKYPIHTGMQHGVIMADQPYGLSLNETLLPQHLNRLGYVSHAVGKWHLGCFKEAYTPTHRGFHSFYGYWKGKKDYFDHVNLASKQQWGYDFRQNMTVARNAFGQYSTDLFTKKAVEIIRKYSSSSGHITPPLFLYLAHQAVHAGNAYEPLQAPQPLVDQFWHIKNGKRRRFAAMLSRLDESVGAVVAALYDTGLLVNSVVVFTADNGGAAAGYDGNAASNWPLRGGKNTLWQGGVRGAGLVWSPLLRKQSYVYSGLMHITDLFPTLISAAGGDVSELDSTLDGVDMWHVLSNNFTSPRHQVLLNIDGDNTYSALISGHLKYISGSNPNKRWSKWHGPKGRKAKRYHIYKKMRRSKTARTLSKLGTHVTYNQWKELRSSMNVHCGKKPPLSAADCDRGECLFDLEKDPCEFNDLSKERPEDTARLRHLMAKYRTTAVAPRNKPGDKRANPKYWNYVWTNWGDFV